MRIACLGWGSLIWRPEALRIRRPWFSDGPLLPIEFARRSSDDRITLVLVPLVLQYTVVRSLWALMSISDLDEAKKELAKREGIYEMKIKRDIGYWCSDSKNGDFADAIGAWASSKGLDAVIWTALPPKSPGGKTGDFPIADQVVGFLRELPHFKRKSAEEYIRNTPVQIDTEYRRQIERELGWTPYSGEKRD